MRQARSPPHRAGERTRTSVGPADSRSSNPSNSLTSPSETALGTTYAVLFHLMARDHAAKSWPRPRVCDTLSYM
jgi:hypothetical protein